MSAGSHTSRYALISIYLTKVKKVKGIGFIVLYHVSHDFTIYQFNTLPDILNKPTVWHTQVHVRKQVVVSRMPTSVITMMQLPIGWELNSDRPCRSPGC